MSLKRSLYPIPEGFPSLPTYSAQWRAVRFELSPGIGEWMTSHIAICDADGSAVRQVIRPAVLKAMFGSSSKHFQSLLNLVQTALEEYLDRGEELSCWNPPVEGFGATELRIAFARGGRIQALRMAARQSTAICSLDDLDLPLEQALSDEEAGSWVNRVKELVAVARPDLSEYFDRQGMLYTESVRFGFLTDRVGAHFGNLTPNAVATSMRMARGKLQELRIGARTLNLGHARLVAGLPAGDDIQWTERQIEATHRASEELRLEADESNVELVVAHTVNDAARAILELVS